MLILSRTGVLVVGVTSVARERGRERERERVSACVRLCLSRLSSCEPPSMFVSSRVCVLGMPWISPFIDTRGCSAVQWGVAMC
jgi:hypothetical protein